MARSTASYTFVNSTALATYRGGAGVVSAQLNAVLARTNDTGQVNFATITTVPSVGNNRDYELFAFTDAMQATKPIIVRVQYGSDGVYLSVGTGSNGAGVLNSGGTIGMSYVPFYTAINSYNQVRYCYTSSDGSYLMLLMNTQAASATTSDSTSAIVIERTRDADGTPNGDGFMIYRWVNSNSDVGTSLQYNSLAGIYGRIYDTAATQPALVYDFASTAPNANTVTSWTLGSTGYAFPVYGHLGNALYGASKAIMLGGINDFTRLSTYPVSHYGQNMTFLGLGTGTPVPMAYSSNATTYTSKMFSPLFRWE